MKKIKPKNSLRLLDQPQREAKVVQIYHGTGSI
jgi:hypothetical protein